MNPKFPPLYKAPQAETKPADASQTAPAPSATTAPVAESAAAPPMTGEGLMKRLRYFENLSEQYEQYISQLKATITRQRGAVPTAYFAPLTGEGGSYKPKG